MCIMDCNNGKQNSENNAFSHPRAVYGNVMKPQISNSNAVRTNANLGKKEVAIQSIQSLRAVSGQTSCSNISLVKNCVVHSCPDSNLQGRNQCVNINKEKLPVSTKGLQRHLDSIERSKEVNRDCIVNSADMTSWAGPVSVKDIVKCIDKDNKNIDNNVNTGFSYTVSPHLKEVGVIFDNYPQKELVRPTSIFPKGGSHEQYKEVVSTVIKTGLPNYKGAKIEIESSLRLHGNTTLKIIRIDIS